MNDLREVGVIFNMILCFRFRSTVNLLPAEKKPQIFYQNHLEFYFYIGRAGKELHMSTGYYFCAKIRSANAN